jgi:hypothetical protein
LGSLPYPKLPKKCAIKTLAYFDAASVTQKKKFYNLDTNQDGIFEKLLGLCKRKDFFSLCRAIGPTDPVSGIFTFISNG